MYRRHLFFYGGLVVDFFVLALVDRILNIDQPFQPKLTHDPNQPRMVVSDIKFIYNKQTINCVFYLCSLCSLILAMMIQTRFPKYDER